ncbi:MAG: DUF4388 domain-containing protein [Chloroflexi bacterium]|nr:DUF4388 domain-containing protein [Chloroflexota bacterium]MBI3740527.1 DUF4388 domain-containing protein [Chloroflexota bacterium]
MALKGNLKDVGINQLLNLIHLAHKTGALSVQSENGGGNARLYFREGKLIYAALDNQETRLTDMLVKIGKLSADQAVAIRQRAQVDTDKALGIAMIQSGVLTQNDIVQGVKNYLLETVYQLLTWAGGAFLFEANLLPPEERITVPINLDHLIIEGGRRVQELEKLREELPDLDVPLKFSERPDANLRNINLSVDQWKIVSFINSRNTIRQIASYLKVDEFQIRRIVYGLQQAGLVELGQAPRPTESVLATLPPPTAPNVQRGVLLRVIDRLRGL